MGVSVAETASLLESFYRRLSGLTARGYRSDLEDLARFMLPSGAANALLPGMEAQADAAVEQAVHALLNSTEATANETIEDWLDDMKRRRLAPASRNRRLAAVKSLLRRARRPRKLIDWQLDVNGARIEARRDMRGPDLDAVARMIAAAAGGPKPAIAARDAAMMALIACMGLRRSEVVGLDIEHADMASATLWVKRKRHAERQPMGMPGPARDMMANWLACRPTDRGPALFVNFNRRGGGDCRISGESLYEAMRRYAAAVGLDPSRISPHRVRHTAITEAVVAGAAAGASLDEVLPFSGHKDVKTLLIYRDQKRNIQGFLAEAVARAIPARPSRAEREETRK